MDEFFFEEEMKACELAEETTYSLELMNYSVSDMLKGRMRSRIIGSSGAARNHTYIVEAANHRLIRIRI